MMENSKKRTSVPDACFEKALLLVDRMRVIRMTEKGDGTFASIHEALGIITEEYYELIEAVKNNDRVNFKHELIDIAVACVFGIACIDAGTMDW